MQDDVSRLVGIEGLGVTRVVDLGSCLLIGVELLVPAGCCRWCGRSSLTVKERPVVRVRDLPIAGRATYLLWRKAPLWVRGVRTHVHRVAPRAAAAPAGQRAVSRAAV